MDEVKQSEDSGTVVPTTSIARLARQHLSRWAENLLANEQGIEQVKKLALSLAGNPELRRNIAFLIRDFCAERMRSEIRRFNWRLWAPSPCPRAIPA